MKEPESEDSEISWPICISKNEKASSGENIKGMAGQCLLKGMWMLWFMKPINHLSRNTASLNWRGQRWEEMKQRGVVGSWDSTGMNKADRVIWSWTCFKKTGVTLKVTQRLECVPLLLQAQSTQSWKAGLSPPLGEEDGPRDGASFCVSESGQLLNSNGWGCCRIEGERPHPRGTGGRIIQPLRIILKP